MTLRTLALAALAVLPFEVACDFECFADSNRFHEDFQYSYDLKPGGALTIDNFNGSVEILSWEKDSVQVTGTKYAAHQEDLSQLKIEGQTTGNAVTLRTVRPGNRGNMGAKYFVRVPRQIRLEKIVTTNGPIRVEDIQGDAQLQTTNGAIRIRKLAGKLQARTSNSSIEGIDLDSDCTLKSSNGSIRLERVRGALDASTTNSGIHVMLASPRAGQPLSFHTTNGGIELAFDNLESSELRANTSNSGITLRLPTNVKARLRANTSNSSITNELDISTTVSGKHELEGTINGGGPLIDLSTTNGPIRLLRL